MIGQLTHAAWKFERRDHYNGPTYWDFASTDPTKHPYRIGGPVIPLYEFKQPPDQHLTPPTEYHSMSLETAIAENTAAIRELIAALASTPLPTHGTVSSADTDKPLDPPFKTPTPAPQPEATKPTITYKDAATVFLKVIAAKGRDTAIKLVGEVKPGATKLPDLVANKDAVPSADEAALLAAIVAKCNEALA